MAEKLIIANTKTQAVSLKDKSSSFLAGGTEVNRLGTSITSSTLISISKISDLKGIAIVEDKTPSCHEGSCCKASKILRIGAMSTFQEVIENDLVPAYFKDACLFMASRTKRNMATIGGNVSLRRDDSYIYPTLLASKAKLELLDKDGNTIYKCAKRYLEDYQEFSDNLIVAILLPIENVSVYSKRIANTAQSHSVLTVSVGFNCNKLFIGAAIKNSALVNMDCLSEKLSEKDMDETEILQIIRSCNSLNFASDIYGSAEYKSYLLSVLVCDLARKAKGGSR